jgi:hypothetical protein
MKKMLINLLLAAGALAVAGVAIVLILASLKPDTFRVQRSVAIAAPPEAIYPLIEDFREMQKWSPFEKSDPAMKRTLSGPDRGVGAVYEWKGNSMAGEGRIEIVEAVPDSSVTMDLHMLKPFGCRNVVLYTIEPEGDSTRVTWNMEGPSPFIGKVMQVFMNMDGVCGVQFGRDSRV